MPELPEVETTRRGIEPHLSRRRIAALDIRQPQLRWPIPRDIQQAVGQRIDAIQRRAKYLLLRLQQGTILMHLGMTGSLRILPADRPPGKHDHVDIHLDNRTLLRFNDPRRFGAMLWWTDAPETHPLLRNLGPEPLTPAFDGNHLWGRSRGRRNAVKNFLMDGHVVVGVGNIYASEALFLAGIHPNRAAGRIARQRYDKLAGAVKQILSDAITLGGTTLRDFTSADGEPGYFAQQLLVYGRTGQPCVHCGNTVRQRRIGQRSSFYCGRCQR